MRRTIFIVLLTVVFTVLTFIAGVVGFALLGFSGTASWREATVVFIGRSWSVLFFGMPVLGLVLGSFGKLPGTRRIESDSQV